MVAVNYIFFTYACAIPINIVPVLIMILAYIYIWKIVQERGKQKQERQRDLNQESISRERTDVSKFRNYVIILCETKYLFKNVFYDYDLFFKIYLFES